VRNRKSLVEWCLTKAEEYLGSAGDNLKNDRLYPAAEEIFRAVETTLEALLYLSGVNKIEYRHHGKEFVGRLALQYLIRNTLLKQERISKQEHDFYLTLATELHQAGYSYGTTFHKRRLEEYIEFAEKLFYKVKALAAE